MLSAPLGAHGTRRNVREAAPTSTASAPHFQLYMKVSETKDLDHQAGWLVN